MSTSVILLCAGRSKKMQSYGTRSLLPIKGGTVIERQLDAIKKGLRASDVVAVLGYEQEKLYHHLRGQVRCVINENYEYTGSLKSTLLGIRATTNDNVFIIHGDIIFKKSIFGLNKRRSASIIRESGVNDIGILLNPSKGVLRFSYGLNNSWSKIIYLNKEGARRVRDFQIDPNKERYLDFEMYNQLISDGLELDAVKGNVIEINSTKDLKNLQ